MSQYEVGVAYYIKKEFIKKKIAHVSLGVKRDTPKRKPLTVV